LDEFEQLGLIAEIAAAFLGFIAIFLALSKADGRFAESDRHFIQALVVTATLTIVLALSPRAISLFATDAMTWFSATILAITLGSLAMFVQARQQFRMSRDEAVQIHWVWHLVAWALGICAAIFFVLALVDSGRASAYFVGGVSLQVALSLWVFIGVVFRRFF
jgi:hypothetical protein